MAEPYTNPGTWKLVNKSVTILATRYGLHRDQAYEILRSATNDGRPIGEVAKGIVAAYGASER